MYDFEFALVVGEWLFRICVVLGAIGLISWIFSTIKTRRAEKLEKERRDREWNEILKSLK